MSVYGQILSGHKGCTCFDIGAYCLEKSKEMLSSGAGKVIAVEPQASLLKLQSTDSIIVVEKAVGDAEGKVEFSICRQAYTVSTMAEHWKTGRFQQFDWSRKLEVDVTTLDNLIAEYGLPYFCKIDVEGYEQNVLQGLSVAIPCISFEFTAEFIENAYQCIHLLEKLGNYHFAMTVMTNNPRDFDVDWTSSDKLESLLEMNLTLPDFWGDIYGALV